MKQIAEYTDISFIKKIESRDKYRAIEELAMVFNDTGTCSNMEALIQALKEREIIMSTGIGFGIAIPHAKIKDVSHISFAIGISKEGIDFDSIDGKPVQLIILVAAGEGQHKDYLKILSKIMSILKNEAIKENIINFKHPSEIMDILKNQ